MIYPTWLASSLWCPICLGTGSNPLPSNREFSASPAKIRKQLLLLRGCAFTASSDPSVRPFSKSRALTTNIRPLVPCSRDTSRKNKAGHTDYQEPPIQEITNSPHPVSQNRKIQSACLTNSRNWDNERRGGRGGGGHKPWYFFRLAKQSHSKIQMPSCKNCWYNDMVKYLKEGQFTQVDNRLLFADATQQQSSLDIWRWTIKTRTNTIVAKWLERPTCELLHYLQTPERPSQLPEYDHREQKSHTEPQVCWRTELQTVSWWRVPLHFPAEILSVMIAEAFHVNASLLS